MMNNLTTSEALNRIFNAIDTTDDYWVVAFDTIVERLDFVWDNDTEQFVSQDTGDVV
jgi:hypothetical protein